MCTQGVLPFKVWKKEKMDILLQTFAPAEVKRQRVSVSRDARTPYCCAMEILFVFQHFSFFQRLISHFAQPKPTDKKMEINNFPPPTLHPPFFKQIKSGKIMQLILLSFEQQPRMCPCPQGEKGKETRARRRGSEGAREAECVFVSVPQVSLPIVNPGR